MATLLNANLPSDDEEDDDYDPTKDKTGSDDEKKKTANATAGRIGVRHRGPCGPASSSPQEGGKRDRGEEREEAAPLTSSQLAKKARVDDIWASLKQRAGAGSAAKSQPSAAPSPASTVRSPSAAKPQEAKVGLSAPSGSVVLATSSASREDGVTNQKPKSALTSVAAAALAAAKAASSTRPGGRPGMVSVVETRRFAGKDIQLEKTVSSSEAAAAAAAAKKKAGLDAVLASLQGAKKVNILDKTRHDWSGFKKSNAEVDGELEAHQRSGAKYLDKVDFLKRAELREYEQERDKRLAGSVNTRGRL